MARRIEWSASPEEILRQLEELEHSLPLPAENPEEEKKPRRKRLQGRPLELPEVTPWPEAVDGIGVLGGLEATVRRFVVMGEAQAVATALWVVHTYLMDAVEISPILAVVSPTKRCGKTTFLRLLGGLVNRPLLASNITPAALFRVVKQASPTLLIDELDSFSNGNDELRGLLNAGVTRDSSYVVRTVGDDHELRKFSTWCPKALACIGRMPATVEDRSIVIRLERRRPDEPVQPLKAKMLKGLEFLRQRVARFAIDIAPLVAEHEPAIPPQLNDRQADFWEPLLAIAEAAGGDWPARARRAALELSGGLEEDQEVGILLLQDMEAIFEETGADRLPTSTIINHLVDLEGRPWGEWRHGRPLTANGLARLLRPFGVTPRLLREGEKTFRGYALEDLKEPFSRYMGFKVLQVLQPSSEAKICDFQSVTKDPRVTLCKTQNIPSDQGCNTCNTLKGGYIEKGKLKDPERVCTPQGEHLQGKLSTPLGQKKGKGMEPVELARKPHGLVWRPACRTLVAELAGDLEPWRYIFADRTLARVPSWQPYRFAVVTQERCWMVDSDVFFPNAETRKFISGGGGYLLSDEGLWQELGPGGEA